MSPDTSSVIFGRSTTPGAKTEEGIFHLHAGQIFQFIVDIMIGMRNGEKIAAEKLPVVDADIGESKADRSNGRPQPDRDQMQAAELRPKIAGASRTNSISFPPSRAFRRAARSISGSGSTPMTFAAKGAKAGADHWHPPDPQGMGARQLRGLTHAKMVELNRRRRYCRAVANRPEERAKQRERTADKCFV